MKTPTKITVTGGASQNKSLTDILANVFGVNVYSILQTDSASLGAAYRAAHGKICQEKGKFVKFSEIFLKTQIVKKELVSVPFPKAHKIYLKMLERYEKLEK